MTSSANSSSVRIPHLSEADAALIQAGRHPDPHSILGPHEVELSPDHVGGITDHTMVVRVLRPLARRVVVVYNSGARVELTHHSHGIWQGISVLGHRGYRIETHYDGGEVSVAEDPYRFLPTVGELDLHLIGEGRHEELWTALGAHYRAHAGVTGTVDGTAFAVWAPHAEAVRVVGDFNDWAGAGHAMRRLGTSGVWELFVPTAAPGSAYKYEICARDGSWVLKADPMAQYTEHPPGTASLIGESFYRWNDSAWVGTRADEPVHRRPMSVYELHVGSWRRGLGYRELADALVDYVGQSGFPHVEFMPLAEHPYGGSWGYQVTGYYAPTSRFGHPDDLRYLIDRLHQAGIGVLLDWVPGHFPRDEWALARFDGEPLYEHPDPRRGEHPDWGTLIFDFGRPEVRNFLVANAVYWLEEFHVDGLRVDAVASMLYLDYSRQDGAWLPNLHGGRENLEAIAFLQEVTATAYKRNPGTVVIAEESTRWPGVTADTTVGGLGFGFTWNMGWMHDSLQYLHHDPVYRRFHHRLLTQSLDWAFEENFVLPISHDEVVHGKGSLFARMPGDPWQKLATVRAYLAFMWAHPGKKLLFMGQDFAQPGEWSEEHGLDWSALDLPAHRGVAEFVAQLNRVYRENPALWLRDTDPGGFEWLDADNADSNVVSFLRWTDSARAIAVLVNFSGVAVSGYRVGLPAVGRWNEILNSDAREFGGSGVGNLGQVTADPSEWKGQPASAEITLPPLTAVFLSPAAPQ